MVSVSIQVSERYRRYSPSRICILDTFQKYLPQPWVTRYKTIRVHGQLLAVAEGVTVMNNFCNHKKEYGHTVKKQYVIHDHTLATASNTQLRSISL